MSMNLRLRGSRSLAAALLLVLGAAGTGRASYCGGAGYRCCPAPVVQAQCNTVALAPQCQTLTQTTYETVVENQPYTVMATRYRTAYRAESYTVLRPAYETTQVARNYCVTRPVYETVNYVQRRCIASTAPSYQTQRLRAALHRLQAPSTQTSYQQRRYCVNRPVYADVRRWSGATRSCKPVYRDGRTSSGSYTVMPAGLRRRRSGWSGATP